MGRTFSKILLKELEFLKITNDISYIEGNDYIEVRNSRHNISKFCEFIFDKFKTNNCILDKILYFGTDSDKSICNFFEYLHSMYDSPKLFKNDVKDSNNLNNEFLSVDIEICPVSFINKHKFSRFFMESIVDFKVLLEKIIEIYQKKNKLFL